MTRNANIQRVLAGMARRVRPHSALALLLTAGCAVDLSAEDREVHSQHPLGAQAQHLRSAVSTTTDDDERDDAAAWRVVEHVPDAQAASTVDHSDILLMLQGCTCISPNCVAYLCPLDVVEILPDGGRAFGLSAREAKEHELAGIEQLLRSDCKICFCVQAEGCPCCGYDDLGTREPR